MASADALTVAVVAMRERRFEDAAVALARAGAGQGELASELMRLGDELARAECEHQELAALSEKIGTGIMLDRVLDEVFDAFRGIIPFDRISCALVERQTMLRCVWVRSTAATRVMAVGYAAPLASSSLPAVMASGKPRILNDLEAYQREHPRSESTRLILAEGMRSSLSCPLRVGGHPVGVLFFSCTTPNAYAQAHSRVFTELASRIAVVVDKSRLYTELSQSKSVIERVNERQAQDLDHARELEARFARLRAHLLSIAAGDHPRPLDPSPLGDNLDSIIVGLNMLVDELSSATYLEERLRTLAHYDALTGLPNRTLFQDRLCMAYERAVRRRSPLAVMYIDLDGFKTINDTHGHAAGDLVLKEVANRLRTAVRASDTVGRIGGDEFAAVLESAGSVEALRSIAAKMRAAVAVPIIGPSLALSVGASVGFAMFPDDTTQLEKMLELADAAMYRAKHLQGGGPGRRVDGGRRRLLLVDDEVDNLELLERAFKPHFDVRRAADAEEALRIVAEWTPDVVVSDQRLPGAQGTSLLAELKHLLPSAVRILVTAYVDSTSVFDAVNEAHIHWFASKPLQRADLDRLVDITLSTPTGGP